MGAGCSLANRQTPGRLSGGFAFCGAHIIGKLREAETVIAQGDMTSEACGRISVTEQTYYRWRRGYGGLETDQALRMKDLEKENARLRHAVSDLDVSRIATNDTEVGTGQAASS